MFPPQRKCHGCILNSNTIVKLQLQFVTLMHHISKTQDCFDDNLPVWPPSLNCGRLLTQASDAEQQLSELSVDRNCCGAWALAAGGVLSVWARLQRSELLRLTTHRCSSGPRIIVKKTTQHILILKEKLFFYTWRKIWHTTYIQYNANDSMWNWCLRQAFTVFVIYIYPCQSLA